MSTPKVVLISGIYNTGKILGSMQASLVASGFVVEKFVPNPNDASVSLATVALELEQFINRSFQEKEKLVIIGFSMGGLIARYYVQKFDLGKRVQKLITIASPHHGTLLAWMLPSIGGREMRPNSDFLCDLEHNSWPDVPSICFWTPYDLMIIPTKSAQLSYAKNICINAWCHVAMMSNQKMFAIIKSELLQL